MKNLTKNFKIIIEYNGSQYHGWQKQKKEKTIQEEIEKALTLITKEKIKIIGSGRTDAGVHALAQVANFKTKNTKLNSKKLQNALNSILSNDIIIKNCKNINNNFHARFDAKSKTYNYHIINNYICSPFKQKIAWHIKRKLNLNYIKKAAPYFIGTHNFKSFQGRDSYIKNTTRTIIKSNIIIYKNKSIIYSIEGNGFLKSMVRNIVGTIVDIGLSKIKLNQINKLFISKNRSIAGRTAPAHGLFLVKVNYFF